VTDPTARINSIEKRMTPGGKVLGVRPVKNSALYELAFDSGGELPDELKNHRWTSVTLADKEAVAYLLRLWDEHDTKAKPTVSKAKESTES